MPTSALPRPCPSVLFLVPEIHALQTGGNVYNRRMIAGMRATMSVRVRAWGTDAASAEALGETRAEVIVVDSLLTRAPRALRALRAARPTATLVLLAHYLACVDPHATDAAVAAAERAALAELDAAITPSQYVRQALLDERFAAEQVRVVPPGLHARYRGACPPHLRQGTARLLTVANVLPTKGLKAFVDVLAGLQDLAWTWQVVGNMSLDADYAASVRQRLGSAGLAHRVVWTGKLAPDALPARYDRADLFVLPSPFETCSLSTREAMARGLPVVGQRVGGMPENFGPAAAGALVPPGNVRDAQAAVRGFLNDALGRRRCGRAAWRQSRTFPTWAEAAARFREALTVLHARTTEA